MSESKRVKKFCLTIAKNIPIFPNNKQTRQKLLNEPLGTLLIHYANWASRYVSIRPRVVEVYCEVEDSPRGGILSGLITTFLKKVTEGEDLTTYLSLKPHTRGYSPEASGTGPNVNRWADKDFLLTVMGYHHFHLGPICGEKGLAARTNEILFAYVSREKFEVLGVFDHSVFVSSSSSHHEMSQERSRLWATFDAHSSRGRPSDSVVISGAITTSGHALHLVMLAQDYSRVIRDVDPLLDDPTYVKRLYETANEPLPNKLRLEWKLIFLDLGLWDQKLNRFFILRKGPN
ncbi:MAG: hypothetical protein NPIRA06_03050 [Nitrospirales bacterium]|nr:MAG: hypothetical protein NPIRA06_03050 [Nitrospirales bacterium]